MKFYVSCHNTRNNTASIHGFKVEKEAFTIYFDMIKLNLKDRYYTISKGPDKVFIDSRDYVNVS